MTDAQLSTLSALFMSIAGGIAWLIKRQAMKRDEAEKIEKEQDKAEQVERIAHAPALQEIVSKHVETLMSVQNQRIEQLIAENTDQRRRHTEDRRSWDAERKAEREEWNREREEWGRTRRRLEKIIDELRDELAPHRRDSGARTRKEDGNVDG